MLCQKSLPSTKSQNNDEGAPYSIKTVIIYYDNQGAVALAKNLESHSRNNHIDIQWRENVEDGSVEQSYTYRAANCWWIDQTTNKREIFRIS